MLLIPLFAFFVLVIAGLWLGELSLIQVFLFVAALGIALAIFMFLGLPQGIFIGVIALLDIVLILRHFGSDISLR